MTPVIKLDVFNMLDINTISITCLINVSAPVLKRLHFDRWVVILRSQWYKGILWLIHVIEPLLTWLQLMLSTQFVTDYPGLRISINAQFCLDYQHQVTDYSNGDLWSWFLPIWMEFSSIILTYLYILRTLLQTLLFLLYLLCEVSLLGSDTEPACHI